MDIRQLDTHDWEAYKEIRLEALTVAPEAFGYSFEEESRWSDEQFINTFKDNIVFGAFDSGELIGVAGYYTISAIRASHRGVVWGMYVQPKHRGKGLGDQLLSAVIEHASLHVSQLQLMVVTTNLPGIHLYQKYGFIIYGTEPRAMKINDQYYDEYLMWKKLS